jgi:hypothetical protein
MPNKAASEDAGSSNLDLLSSLFMQQVISGAFK